MQWLIEKGNENNYRFKADYGSEEFSGFVNVCTRQQEKERETELK